MTNLQHATSNSHRNVGLVIQTLEYDILSERTAAKDQFAYYRSKLHCIEINNSFYRLPNEETLRKWKTEAEPDFGFVLKASRYITHMKQLRDPRESFELFFERAAVLGEKLLAILFQLPPRMKQDLAKLETFLEALPRGYRYAVEFRNADWYTPEAYQLLRKYNCAFCIYELEHHQSPFEVTADFVYVRLHGPGNKYQGNYSDEALAHWASRCQEWLESKDVFVFFDNDENGYAAFNAIRLAEFVLSSRV